MTIGAIKAAEKRLCAAIVKAIHEFTEDMGEPPRDIRLKAIEHTGPTEAGARTKSIIGYQVEIDPPYY